MFDQQNPNNIPTIQTNTNKISRTMPTEYRGKCKIQFDEILETPQHVRKDLGISVFVRARILVNYHK